MARRLKKRPTTRRWLASEYQAVTPLLSTPQLYRQIVHVLGIHGAPLTADELYRRLRALGWRWTKRAIDAALVYGQLRWLATGDGVQPCEPPGWRSTSFYRVVLDQPEAERPVLEMGTWPSTPDQFWRAQDAKLTPEERAARQKAVEDAVDRLAIIAEVEFERLGTGTGKAH
jgi:hypothetical protein